MPITRTPMVDDDGSGTTGTIINNAWKSELYGQIDALVGTWVDVAFNAANYTASAGTWTVGVSNQVTLAYAIVNKTVYVLFSIQDSANSASTVRLSIAWPGMPPSNRTAFSTLNYYQGNNPGTGVVEIDSGATKVNFLRDIAGTPWSVNPGGVHLRGLLFYSIA